mgnify:CR=1 FL=1
MQKPLTFLAPFVVAASLALPAVAQDDTAENTDAQTDVTAETVVATVNGTDITIGSMIIARATLPEQYQQLPPAVLFKGILDQLVQQTALSQDFDGEVPKRIEMALENERRQLIAGGAVGGGLVVAWWLWPRHYSSPLAPGPDEREFGGWITIGKDGVVTVAVPQLEMGQGVATVFAQIVAVELGADWQQVAVEPAPPSGLYANIPLAAKWAPLWSAFPALADEPDSFLADRFARSEAFAATADGTTLAAFEADCRAAGAAASSGSSGQPSVMTASGS